MFTGGSQQDEETGAAETILVVDDDPHTLRYVRKALSDAGYRPIVTADPEEVISLVEEQRPHLALLDMVLPGSDGIEIMGDIFASSDVPVIFTSAYGRDEVVARALEGGARRLHRQALLSHRAGRPGAGGSPQAQGHRKAGAAGVLHSGRPDHRLRPAAGHPRRAAGVR